MIKMLAAALFASFLSTAAFAGPLTNSSSNVVGSDGNSYQYIGALYDTTAASYNVSNGQFTLNFTTTFPGLENVGGYNVGLADVFFNNGLSLALGGQNKAAGLYRTSTSETSNQVWNGRSGVVWGAGITINGITQQEQTVITSGTFLENATVVETSLGNGSYNLAITLTDNAMLDAAINSGFFWGTGDCGNGGGEWAVPEPGTMFLLLMATITLFIANRKKNIT